VLDLPIVGRFKLQLQIQLLEEYSMIKLTINDMTCGGCVASITRVVKGLDPNAKVDANVETKNVNIDSPVDTEAVVAAITNAGFHPYAAS
jgi:copper chaperone CopZ